MFRLTTDMQLGSFIFDFVNEVSISSSWDLFTDFATVTIPSKLSYKKDGVATKVLINGANPVFVLGDLVDINLGYDNELTNRFSGFISNVSPRKPVLIEAQDPGYNLKQTTIKNFSKKNVTLPSLLGEISPIPFIAEDLQLGYVRINETNFVKVLDWIKRNYGLISYIRDAQLIVGFPYLTEAKETDIEVIDIRFGRDIIDDTDLIYKSKDDIKIKLKATIIFPDNTKIEFTLGDETGDVRTLFYYDVKEADAREMAEQDLQKFKFDGFRGTFEMFLDPVIKHGNEVNLINPEVPDQNGRYKVKQVDTSFGMAGGRQIIHLDYQV